MKKILSLFLSIITAITMLTFAVPAQAADTIQSGQSVDVVFTGERTTTKNFVYTMPASGYMYYSITPKYGRTWYEATEDEPYSEERSTNFYLEESKLTYNYKEYVRVGYIGYGDNWHSQKFAFKKGSQINISLSDTASENSEYAYILKVYFVKVNNFETENNNSKKTANKLALKKTYTGNLVPDDVDYWVFKAPKTGKYKISAVCTEEDAYYDNFWAFKGSKEVGSLFTRTGDGYGTVFKGKLKKNQKIYIKVQGNNGDGDMYKLKVKKL